MADIAHRWTDDEIDKLIEKIEYTYSQAEYEIQKKLTEYLEQFAKQDEYQQLLLSQGKISPSDYKSWRYSKMLTGQRWADMRNVLATDYMHANQLAMSMVTNELPKVYAYNANYAVYQIEHDYKTATSYTLYNRKAIEYLMKDDPSLLPYARTNSPTANLLKQRADLIWNRQKINNAVTQGILQGESVYKVADRLQKVTNMNYSAAVRNARTMMTAAENKGRDDAYEELREQGYEVKNIWIATLDSVTRESHRLLHGTEKGEDGYYMNGLEYPGDPDGAPEEVYNCRCCEIGELPKYGKYEIPHYSPKMGTLTYEEWLNGGSGHPIWTEPQVAVAPAVITVYTANNYEELRTAFADRNMTFDSSVEPLDFNAIKEGCEGIADIMDEFPQAQDTFKGIGTSRSGMMCASFSGQINFNPSYFTDASVITNSCIRCYNTNYHPSDTIPSVGAHEAGHILELALINKKYPPGSYEAWIYSGEAWDKCKEAQRIVSQACKDAKKTPEGAGMLNAMLKQDVSGYAMTNASECLAECVSDYYANREDASILSKCVWKRLKDELG